MRHGNVIDMQPRVITWGGRPPQSSLPGREYPESSITQRMHSDSLCLRRGDVCSGPIVSTPRALLGWVAVKNHAGFKTQRWAGHAMADVTLAITVQTDALIVRDRKPPLPGTRLIRMVSPAMIDQTG
jgi:hypothetical protein